MSEQPEENTAAASSAQILLSSKEAPKTFPQALIDALEFACAEAAEALEEQSESKVRIGLSNTSLVDAAEPIDYAKYLLRYVVRSEAEDWSFMFAVSRSALYDYLELALGATGRGSPVAEDKVPTAIDIAIGRSFAERITKALGAALKESGELNFNGILCEQYVEDPDAPPVHEDMYRADLTILLFGEETEFVMAFPAAQFGVLANADITAHIPPPAAANEEWTNHMSSEARRATVELTAKLSGGYATLDSLSQLKPGTILPLQASPNSTVDLECNSVPLMRCKFGQAEGKYTLSVESFIRPSDRSTERELAVALGMLESA